MIGVYTSLEDVLNYLESLEAEEVKQLLHLYKQAKTNCCPSKERNHIFIVFEGLDGSGKSTMTKMAAKALNMVQIATPPKNIQHLRSYFDQCESKLRRAYYSLGNYMAAMEVDKLLSDHHVVMDRFWHSTSAYALAESTAAIPASGDSVYKWPTDLLKPDLIMFLSVEESERLRRTAKRLETMEENKLKMDNEFRARLHEAYSRMEGLRTVRSNGIPKKVFQSLMETEIAPLINQTS